MKRPIVGQQIFVCPVGNALRSNYRKPCYWTVTSVGRKYFMAKSNKGSREYRFTLDRWRESDGVYASNYQAYESDQDYFDEAESIELKKEISDVFNPMSRSSEKLSLPTLRQIKKLIDDE